MAVDYISYSGLSNVGFGMDVNEDYILFNEDDFGDFLFASIADGAGSKDSPFRPGAIISHQIEKVMKRFYAKKPDMLKENVRLFMEEAYLSANDALIAFKLGDEAERMNYASASSSVFIEKNGKLTFAHVGNTRIYLLRDTQPLQLTKDHTEAQKLVDAGAITKEAYYTAMERLFLYNGLGIKPTPDIQTGQIQLKKNDVIIMTTDGIHYSFRPDAFFEILMKTETMDDAAKMMVETALKLRMFPDNISVNVLWYHGAN